ncbi:aspartyl protease family protein At5g10770-like [Phalaenopsis equestris]|uniref:aspartyl protease family protein At5g10770-like n=1 Tax=Phalaenopsis equestris TaxID=78828 RepID=UPI0009E1DC1E|nr:aspartyl protease family protein At5g10770-like [Phalaenopsis equestris]
MATAPPPSSPLFSCCVFLNVFLSLLLIERSSVVAARGLAGEHHVIDVKSLLSTSSNCSLPDKGASPSKLKVVHRHGPCSSLPRQNKPSHLQLLRQDQSRVDSIHCRSAAAAAPVGGSLSAKLPANTGTSLGSGNYIVTIGLGTPKKSFSVVFDTGSDLTWTQCLPCDSCYTQNDPLYDPTQSSTFTNISCNSNYCTQLDQSSCSSTSTCLYQVQYGDNSQTQGSLIQDTLTFSSDSIPNFRFGCGHDNSGLFGKVDGLLGLGREPASIVSQTDQLYGKVFSYCLPSTSSAAGYLELGSTAAGVQYTPMLTNQNLPSFYFLNLVAISVGGQKLALSPTVFSNPGTLLDSGTVISRLPPTAYAALRSSFRRYMTNYPTAPALSILDTCYDFTNYQTVKVPSIALLFGGGVTANLDFKGILYVASISQACLAFAGNNDAGDVVIIGNVQQRRFNVVYDVGNLKIGFGANGCS